MGFIIRTRTAWKAVFGLPPLRFIPEILDKTGEFGKLGNHPHHSERKGGTHMGFFDKLFGGTKDYPPLDAGSPAATTLEQQREPLAELAGEISDPLEVIPSEDRSYIYFGNPPKQFGFAWVQSGKAFKLKDLAEKQGVPMERLSPIILRLRDVYERSKDEPRFSSRIAEREIIVIPSQRLAGEIGEVLEKVIG
jgi:hypothetical protein